MASGLFVEGPGTHALRPGMRSEGEGCAVLAFYPLRGFATACPGNAGFGVAELGLSNALL
jgi:hypothetical protein